MADQDLPDNPEDLVPIEGDGADAGAAEPRHPRRAASAEFIVKSEAQGASVLREAMDPANQSLAEALRLSYRVLQLVIVVLLALFLASGFRNIENTQTGVRTLFGRIQSDENGDAALIPGLNVSLLPYPAVEFIVFNQNNAASVTEPFWPNTFLARQPNFEAAAATVRATDAFAFGLGPGRDGYVLVEDGFAHLQLQANYSIDNAQQFVENVLSEQESGRIVRYALQRAVVHTMAAMKFDDAIESGEVIGARVRETAQSMLDDLETGIALDRVQVSSVKPPIPLVNTLTSLTTATTQAENAAAQARRDAGAELQQTAGENFQEVLDLIDEYELALLDAGEQGPRHPEAERILSQIDELLQGERVGGVVAQRIAAARSYKDEIEATLGALARRFEGLLPAFRQDRDFVVRQQWIDTYRRILGGKQVEIVALPAQLGAFHTQVKSLQSVMQIRREARQRRQEAEAMGLVDPFRIRMGEDKVNRRLELNRGTGEVTGRGQNRN